MIEEDSVRVENSFEIYRHQVKSIKRLNRLATVINALGLAFGLAVMFVSPGLAMALVISSIVVYAVLRDRAGRREENLELPNDNTGQLVEMQSGELVRELARQISKQIPVERLVEEGKLKLELPSEVQFEASFSDLKAQVRLKLEEHSGDERTEKSSRKSP